MRSSVASSARPVMTQHRRASSAATSALVAVAALSVLGTWACGGSADAKGSSSGALVVAHIAPSTAVGESSERGAVLGAEEAGRTGGLLGRAFELRRGHADDAAASVRVAGRLLDEGAVAIVGGFDSETCEALDSLARARGALFVNVGCRADALRASPGSLTFHVEASDSMYLGAMGAMRGSGGAAPVLWHGGLARYGAAQLNQRFARRFGQRPDAATWASWMAMKLLWQGALGAHASDATRLASHLLGAESEFDGHKGQALTFDAVTHQLRQPLFPPPGARESASRNASAGVTLGEAAVSERGALRAAVDGGKRLLVVTNEGSSDVTIADATDGRRLATIPLAERPRGIHLSPDGRRAWVALSDESPTEEGDGDAVAVIDVREGKVVARHAAGSDPEQFVVNGAGTLMVSANEDAGTATVTDLRRDSVIATLLVGIEPEGVAMSPDGRVAYVTAETSNTVSAIDVPRREVVASFLVDERPRAAAFAPDGRVAFVTNEISGTLSVVDVARHSIVETILLAGGRARPVGVVVSPDGATVYVANGHDNSVSVVDVATRRETATIGVGRRPWGLALTADGSTLYSANGGSNDVSVIDTRTRRVTATIAVGERPWGVGVTR